jgi:uncharacterized protein (DUF302 family)
MEMSDFAYGIKRHSAADLVDAEARLREALAAEGFGILTEIDVAETLRAKLGVERSPYRILGACNPELAALALDAELDVGLLLPCNVIVYDDGGGTVVAALDPATMVDITANPELEPIARDARARLERALAVAVAG